MPFIRLRKFLSSSLRVFVMSQCFSVSIEIITFFLLYSANVVKEFFKKLNQCNILWDNYHCVTLLYHFYILMAFDLLTFLKDCPFTFMGHIGLRFSFSYLEFDIRIILDSINYLGIILSSIFGKSLSKIDIIFSQLLIEFTSKTICPCRFLCEKF